MLRHLLRLASRASAAPLLGIAALVKRCGSTGALAFIVTGLLLGGASGASADTWYEINIQNSHGQSLSADGGGGGSVFSKWIGVGTWEMIRLRDQNGGLLEDGDIVQLTAWNGMYFSAEGGGGAGSVVNANRPQAGGWEAWTIHKLSGGDRVIRAGDQVSFLSLNSYYMSANYDDPDVHIVADKPWCKSWETFTITVFGALVSRQMAWPTDDHRLSGYGFGDDWGSYGPDGYLKRHNGWDLRAGAGASVYAAEAGLVRYTGIDANWGPWIVLEHADQYGRTYTTLYFHVTSLVKTNQRVSKGQKIGSVYRLIKNNQDISHCHFGIRNAPFSGGDFNPNYAVPAASAANRGALPRTGSYWESGAWSPKFSEYFLNPGIYLH